MNKVVSKRERFQLARGLLWGIAILTSVIGIGILIGYQLNQSERAFESLQKSAQELKLKAEAMTRKEGIIDRYIQKAYQLTEDFSTLFPKKKEELQNTLIKNWKSLSTSPPNQVQQFVNDMTRFGVTFQITDEKKNVRDDKPIPAKEEVMGENSLEIATKHLHQLCLSNEDQPWERVLQSIATQTASSILLSSYITEFNKNSALINWEETGKEGERYLKVALSDPRPPLQLEILRNEKGDIEKVNVGVTAFLNFENTPVESQYKDMEIIKSNAIQGKMTFSVILNPEKEPLVSEFNSVLSYEK